MRPSLKYLTAACAAALLLACADVVQHHGQSTAAATAMADEAYAIARSQHMARRYDDAATSYQAALGALPGHQGALNGLAALKAEQGDLDGAIALWQPLASEEAAKGGAGNAYLFANLGYAYFLKGEHQHALASLEKACVLDPLSWRAWDRLAGVLDKLGQRTRAARMARQAATLRAHDFSADYAAVERSGVAAIDFAVKSADQNDGEQWDSTEVREEQPGIFVLHRVKAGQGARSAAALPFELPGASRITVGPDGMVTLEIRNGNGIGGAARALAGKMGDPSLRVVRLTNHKGYGVQRTRVEYRPAYRAAAEKLAARVGTSRMVARDQLGATDLRLIIGRDLRPGKIAAVPAAAPSIANVPKEAGKAG